MKNVSVFKIALLLAALLFIIVFGFAFSGHLASAGPLAIAAFLALALGCRGYELTRGLTYTVVIFAAVTTALYYPQYFLVWGDFKLAALITPLIQIIMFGMGTSMGLKDFAGVIRTPKGVVIGVCSHFIIMPLIGFTLARLSGLPPEIAAGIILIGCSPNGLASNVISYLAKANLALSITITAVSTLLAPFVTPFLMKWLAGAFVHIDALSMMWDIIKMVIIPIGAGILFNKLFSGKAGWLHKAMPLVSMTGIACIIVVITAAGRNSLLTIGPLLVVFVLLHNLSGYTLGYWTGRLFRMDERDCRTMAIEVGMQNGGLASGLAKEMGKMATVGLAPAIFGPLMNVTGSILASYWHRKPPKDPASGQRVTGPGVPATGQGVPATAAPTSTSSTTLVILVISASLLFTGCGSHTPATMETGADYPVYGGNRANNRYSPLNQITLANVKNLRVTWTYDAREPQDAGASGAQPGRKGPGRPKEIQCQPIVVGGVLYGTTAQLNLFALNAATGQRLWLFEPAKENIKFNTSRGVVYWEKGNDRRIFFSAGSSLYAVDATTGKLIPTFGSNGRIDLHEGLDAGLHHDINNLSVTSSTPGVICRDVLVMGSSVSEGGDAAPGHIRGFDVTTGKLLWIFHTIPQPGESGYETWPKDAYEKFGGANAWGGLSADEKRGMVYFGTGSPSSDFYGGDRAGMNLFGNCIVALDAVSGKMKWYFQTVHHDLWDRDIPCPPNLVTVKHNGRMTDALVQTTKDGMVYVLDRDSGRSLFPIVELPVPAKGLPGEFPWPTQPHPQKPAPLSRQALDTSFASKFTPPDTAATYLFGYSGGAEWGGNATTPDGILYQNANQDAWELRMTDRAERDRALTALSPGNALYVKTCSFCHGMDRKGSGSQFPELLNVGQRRNAAGIAEIIRNGSGRMPSFGYLSDKDRSALAAYLLGKEKPAHHAAAATGARPASGHPASTAPSGSTAAIAAESEHNSVTDTAHGPANSFPYLPKFVSQVWRRWADSNGYNKSPTPWGTLNAIDLNTGDYVWTVPFGEYPELAKKGIPVTGTESYGGPLVTAGDLLFIAATRDEKIRAFNRHTGAVVWEYQLPAGGFATPITYEVDGKQYIVIAAGGARGAKPGGWYVAFSLPE